MPFDFPNPFKKFYRVFGGQRGYTGPLDTFSNISAAFGVRRLRSAYNGYLVGLRRDSDNAEMSFSASSDGSLDTAAIATWLGGANGYVHTLYDQSGNSNNATQTTAGNQPLFTASIIGTRPGIKFDGSDDFMTLSAHTYAIGNLYITSLAVVRHAAVGVIQAIFTDCLGSMYRYIFGTNNANTTTNWRRYNSVDTATANAAILSAVNTNYVMAAVANSNDNTAQIYQNGTLGAAVGALTGPNANLTVIGSNAAIGSSYSLNGYISELCILTDNISAPNRDAYESSAGEYYGITVL